MKKTIALTAEEKQVLHLVLKGGDERKLNSALISSVLEKTNTKNLLQCAIFCIKENAI